MKKIIIGLIALSTLSTFAQSTTVVGGLGFEGETYIQKTCEKNVFEEVMSSKTIKTEFQALLTDAQENLEKISAISRKAQEIASIACN